MIDVLIVGAGPAGAVAATLLARRGARVLILDRATFPRAKLCGDTVNPGTVAMLARLGLGSHLETDGLPVDGMVVTGPGGVAVAGAYPQGVRARSLTRSELDLALLQGALAAGAQFEPGTAVRRALIEGGSKCLVGGVVASGNRPVRARVVVAADGRHSTIAFGLGLARHPDRPRRWAIGAYFDNVARLSGTALHGEMHLRRGGYIGISPIPGGLTNVCLVISRDTPAGPGHLGLNGPTLRDPASVLRRALETDPLLRDRFASARMVTRPVMVGPLAVDVAEQGMDGLVVAGDAAGFIDPMTGDGLRFAVRGAELAAGAAHRVLEHGWTGVHTALTRARRHEFASKWRFNRLLRALVASSGAMHVGEVTAAVAPAILRAIVRHAGDCDLVRADVLQSAATSLHKTVSS
ncbi:MAG TPA: FAD-dependent monooxygenase [Vicinamibacterales bacterium]|jgi:flavin-dependent dehydrogenase|nr:FAD-dependent monooxygenase [Vicinamibacterales bacterium]